MQGFNLSGYTSPDFSNARGALRGLSGSDIPRLGQVALTERLVQRRSPTLFFKKEGAA